MREEKEPTAALVLITLETVTVSVEVVISDLQNPAIRIAASVVGSVCPCVHETSTSHWATWISFATGKILIVEGIQTADGLLLCNIRPTFVRIENQKPRRSVLVGVYEMDKKKLESVLVSDELCEPRKYDVTGQNCHNFCFRLLALLGLPIPQGLHSVKAAGPQPRCKAFVLNWNRPQKDPLPPQ
ncbi:hypothetical protein MTO96_013717 [Rhipicephalus appendiculatus]